MRASNQEGSEIGKDENDARADRSQIRHLPPEMPAQIGWNKQFCVVRNWSLIGLLPSFNQMAKTRWIHSEISVVIEHIHYRQTAIMVQFLRLILRYFWRFLS